MKRYQIYFYIKANKTEYLCDVQVDAHNAKEACASVKQWCDCVNHKNAFRPSIKVEPECKAFYEKRGLIKHFYTDALLDKSERS